MKPHLKFILFSYLFLQCNTISYSQIIVRLWEAEGSAGANVGALLFIKDAETDVKDEMGKLNTELRKQLPYYGLNLIFDAILEKTSTIENIRKKLLKLNDINNKVPLLFNRKKTKNKLKWKMYNDYLDSIDKDVSINFSNNGNLLKTSFEIVSELEEIEKILDDALEDLTISQRVFNLF